MHKIGVLAPAHSIESIKSSLQNTEKVQWEFFPVSRKSTKEQVTVACLPPPPHGNTSTTTKKIDGYLNLCNGRRGENISADVFVSCSEVVEALDELQIPFYSGPTIRSAKYNRKDIAALAFYATEEMKGVHLPCHGSVRISKQMFYENELSETEIETHHHSTEQLFEKSGEMVDKLRYPVIVRPITYSHQSSENNKEEVICNNLKERISAQRHFFEYGHSSVFVDEYFDNDATCVGSVSALCIGYWDSENKKSIVKVIPSEEDIQKLVSNEAVVASSSSSSIQEQVLAINEKLFRGVYDDATCCAPLRGHCLIRLSVVVRKQQQQEHENSSSIHWVIRDIIPNCTLLGDESAPALAILKKSQGENFSNFFASLVEINQAPPRFVELPYRVEYDPKYKWYGLCASRDITKNEIVFHDEVTAFTVVTKPFVEQNWSDDLKTVFSRYAWPLDSDGHLYAVWSEDPQKWRPINHHCDPNTTFAAPHSLNCIATRNIKKGEMLTLDYATFCDYTMKPFNCKCGAECCRGLIEPTAEALSKYGKFAWHRVAPKKPSEE